MKTPRRGETRKTRLGNLWLSGVLILTSSSFTVDTPAWATLSQKAVHYYGVGFFFLAFFSLYRSCFIEKETMEHTLTIEECRQYLGDTNMTDKEIEELRDDLCVLIDNVLEDYFSKIEL